MDLIEKLNSSPDHIKNFIILEVNPKYIHIFKTFTSLSESMKEKYEKWYFEFKKNTSFNSFQKSLIRSLELEYYDLFDRLFENYNKKYVLTRKFLNKLLGKAAFIGNMEYLQLVLKIMNEKEMIPDYQKGMIQGAKGGHCEIMELMSKFKKMKPHDYKMAMEHAAIGYANTKIFKWILNVIDDNISDNEPYYYYQAMINATNSDRNLCNLGNVGNVGSRSEILLLIVEQILKLINSPDIATNPNYYDQAMNLMAEGGQTERIQMMLDQGATNYNQVMMTAARKGQIEIVRMMLDQGATKYNETMKEAAGKGQIEIVKMMLDKGATNYNEAIRDAAWGGQIEIVELMLARGATNYNEAMRDAAWGGQIEIVQLMLDRGATNYNETMRNAARKGQIGQIEIVKMMLDQGATNYNETMREAAEKGQIEIVQLMLDQGANNYDQAMRNAAIGGQIEIVELMLDRGATNYNDVMSWAAREGHIEIVELMLDRGATNYNETMRNAAIDGHIEIVELMLGRGATHYDETMKDASNGSSYTNIEIVKLMIKLMIHQKIRPDYRRALLNAFEGGNMEVFDFLRDNLEKRGEFI